MERPSATERTELKFRSWTTRLLTITAIASVVAIIAGCGSSRSSSSTPAAPTAALRSQLDAAQFDVGKLCTSTGTPSGGADRLQSDISTVVSVALKLHDVRLAEPTERLLDLPAPGAPGGCLAGGAVGMEKRLLTPVPTSNAAFNARLSKERAVGVEGFRPLDQKYLVTHYLAGKPLVQRRCIVGTFPAGADLANFDYLLRVGDPDAHDLLISIEHQCAMSGSATPPSGPSTTNPTGKLQPLAGPLNLHSVESCLRNAGAGIGSLKSLGAGTEGLFAILPHGTQVGIGVAPNIPVAKATVQGLAAIGQYSVSALRNDPRGFVTVKGKSDPSDISLVAKCTSG